jgi:hypothetical protein
MKKLTFAMILFVLFCGCASGVYIAPKSTYIPNTVTINLPYDQVWASTIRIFAKRNWPIGNMDKTSGYIEKGWTSWDIPEASTFMDFGQQIADSPEISVYKGNAMLKYKLLLTKINDSTTDIDITLNGEAHWVFSGIRADTKTSDFALRNWNLKCKTEGKSKGVFEGLIISEIKQSVAR